MNIYIYIIYPYIHISIYPYCSRVWPKWISIWMKQAPPNKIKKQVTIVAFAYHIPHHGNGALAISTSSLGQQKLFFCIQSLVVTPPSNSMCHTCLILIVETWSCSYPKCPIREFDWLLIKLRSASKNLPGFGPQSEDLRTSFQMFKAASSSSSSSSSSLSSSSPCVSCAIAMISIL